MISTVRTALYRNNPQNMEFFHMLCVFLQLKQNRFKNFTALFHVKWMLKLVLHMSPSLRSIHNKFRTRQLKQLYIFFQNKLHQFLTDFIFFSQLSFILFYFCRIIQNTMRYYQKIFHNSYSFLTASIVAFIVCLLKLFFFI